MSTGRRIYLKMTDPEEALSLLLARAAELSELPAETIPTTAALDRVTAVAIYAHASSPTFPAAAMDGYAVASALTFAASEAEPVTLAVPREAEPVDTGEALPVGKDAVCKIEDVHEQPEAITVLAAAWPGQHVRLVGEEVAAGELLVTSGQRLTPRHIGLLLAAQVWSVAVRRKPAVTIVPTGAECIPAGQEPAKDQFVEYNGPMLAAALTQWGAQPRLLPPVANDAKLLSTAINQAADSSDVADVELLVPPDQIERSIVAVGSHDLALAAVAEHLAQHPPLLHLVCLSTGSTEGLAALGRGEGHIAGTHLLDAATQEYNVPYVQRWLADLPLVLVNLAFREVGLLVRKGNPQALRELADLTRHDVTFINRQPGSGTRVLLDFLLHQRNIATAAVTGYEREAYTHTMVAEAIRQGSADVGLGIRAAAQAFGLDFVPVTEERYDLAVPKALLELSKISALLQTLRSPAVHAAIEQLGGYSVRKTGEIVYEQ